MSHQISEFEQFLLLFNQLQATAGTPSRFKTFYSESAPIRRAGDALESFLMRTDFERKKFHGPKRFLQVPANFENRWREFKEDWQPLLYDIIFADLLPLLELEPDYDPEAKTDQLVSPDPETDSNFDPMCHDGGAALDLGIGYLEHEYECRKDGEFIDDERISNICHIGLGAFEYLKNTIGLDLSDLFRRWRRVPVVFMPAAVSNAHGSEKGSLHDLLDDAVRAYVCGAPAAAMAMCRAALEQTLKTHYLSRSDYIYKTKKNEDREKGLRELISLAEKRYEHIVKKEALDYGIRLADNIMHNYSRERRLDQEDNRAIREFLVTLKTLIEKPGT